MHWYEILFYILVTIAGLCTIIYQCSSWIVTFMFFPASHLLPWMKETWWGITLSVFLAWIVPFILAETPQRHLLTMRFRRKRYLIRTACGRSLDYVRSDEGRKKIREKAAIILQSRRGYRDVLLAELKENADDYIKSVEEDLLIGIVKDLTIDNISELVKNQRLSGPVKRALVKINDPRFIDPLIAISQEKGDIVRECAIEALGKIRDDRATDALIALLKDWYYPIRRKAAAALKSKGYAPTDQQQRVDFASAIPDWDELLALGDSSIGALIEMLGNQDEDVRNAAVVTLGQMGNPAAIPALVETIADKQEFVRMAAKKALEQIDPQWQSTAAAREAIPVLVKALKDKDKEARAVALWILGLIGDPAAIPALVKALGDKDKFVRSGAAVALGQIGNPAAIPALIMALGDDYSLCSDVVEKALRLINPDWRHSAATLEAIPHLASDLQSQKDYVRAARTLGVIADPSTGGSLAECARLRGQQDVADAIERILKTRAEKVSDADLIAVSKLKNVYGTTSRPTGGTIMLVERRN